MFSGSGCAISQASVDMMADQIIGRSKEDAIKLAGTFMGMIKGEIKDEEELEELDEAAALQDISHMPARVKCAVLGWKTMQEMLEHPEKATGEAEQGHRGSSGAGCHRSQASTKTTTTHH